MTDTLSPLFSVGFSAQEREGLRARMWALLKRRVAWESMGDYTSLRVEEAEELLRSIAFTLNTYCARTGTPPRALLTDDLYEMLLKGQDIINELFYEAKTWYDAAVLSVRDFGNRSLRDTLRGIGLFFRHYRPLSYAHQIPADIDYQLALPVSETEEGVNYIREYLRRLLLESSFINRFDENAVRSVLTNYYGGYREPLVNLFEPVAACAVGLSMVDGGIGTLYLDQTQLEALYARFHGLDDAQAYSMTDDASKKVFIRLGQKSDASLAYLSQCARALLPRIRAARDVRALSGVFPAAGVKE